MASTPEKSANVADVPSADRPRSQALRGIFARLSQEHGEAASLVQRLRGSDSHDLRRALFPELRDKLLAHEEAELMELYVVLRRHEETRALVEEHDREAGRLHVLIDEVNALEPDDVSWHQVFARLAEAVARHVAREEGEIFPAANMVLGAARAEELEASYAIARQRILDRLQEPS